MKLDTELDYIHTYTLCGALGGTVLQAGRSLVPFLMVSLQFLIDLILQAAL
jgi:hypothetical protein